MPNSGALETGQVNHFVWSFPRNHQSSLFTMNLDKWFRIVIQHHQRTSPKKWSKDDRTKIAKFLWFVPEVALINLSRNTPGQLVLVFTLDWHEWFSKIYPVFLWNQAKKLSRWRMRGSWIFLLLASPRHGLPTAAQANRLPGRSVDFVAQVINICIKSEARILEEIATFQNQG